MSLKSPKLSLAALGSRRLAPGEQGSLRSRLYDACPATNEDGHGRLCIGIRNAVGGEDQKTTKAELHDLIASVWGQRLALAVPAKMPVRGGICQ